MAVRPALAYAAGLICLLRPTIVCTAEIAGTYDSIDSTELQDVLSHYEVIRAEDIEWTPAVSSAARSRRDVSGGVLTMHFAALGRIFTLYLTADTNIYADGFEAWSVDSMGSKQPILLSDGNLYTGHVQGEVNSQAVLYRNNQATVAKIETSDETYYVEPANGRLSGDSSGLMLAYRLSDVHTTRSIKHDSTSFCGLKEAKRTDHTPIIRDVLRNKRFKRQTPAQNSCSLLLIADYWFYREVAAGSETAAILFMVNMANKVDKIFRRTKWSNGWTGLGFSVKKVLVHTNWTKGDANHYNAERSWTYNQLLLALGNASAHSEPFTKFCLVHLFTGYNFKGLLGYAFMGVPEVDAGICANYFVLHSEDYPVFYENVGFTTQFGRSQRRLLESEAETLLAHELGHGWGSNHDPNTTECAPDPNDLYIMTAIADPHPKRNAKLFSPCSVRAITKVVEKNSYKCFEVDRDATRGNYRVDNGEECDAGITGDHCCGSDFKLNFVDTCSDANHICCQNCSAIDAQGKTCQFESAVNCRAQATCDGVNVDCPITFRENGSVCFPDGSGRCLPQTDESQEAVYCATVCETLGFRNCRCADASSMCKLCCQQPGRPCSVLRRSDYENAVYPCDNDTTKHCRRDDNLAFEPYNWSSDVLALPVDSPCLLGYCDSEGACRKLPQDTLTFGKFLSFLTPGKAVRFMKNNIVGTIIVFSLVIWLPASFCIRQTDRRMEQDERRKRLDSVCVSDLVSPHIARRYTPILHRHPSHVSLHERLERQRTCHRL